MARELLENAQVLCSQPFENSSVLRNAVEQTLEFWGREWYEEVTFEELAMVKAALFGARGGLATYSGH